MLSPASAPGTARLRVPTVVALALLVAAVFAGVYGIFILTVTGQWVDEEALQGARQYLYGTSARKASLSILDELPIMVGVACAVGLLVCAWVRRDVVVPLVAALGAGAAIAATQLLKHEILVRPDTGVSEALMNSFPSGHTTVAAAAAAAVLLAAPRRARPWVALVGTALSAATGSATLVMGWHRPADVVGGYLVVAFFGLIAAAVIARLESTGRHGAVPSRRSTRPGRAALLGCTVLGLVLLIAAAVVLAPHMTPPAGEDRGPFLAAGLLFIFGAACVLTPLLERTVDAWALRFPSPLLTEVPDLPPRPTEPPAGF